MQLVPTKMWKFSIFSIKFWILYTVLAKLIDFSASLPSETLKNFQKFNLSETKPVSSLRVFSNNYEPFMYQNQNGRFYRGIEYKLLESIAKEENLELVFENRSEFQGLERIMRYDKKSDKNLKKIFEKSEAFFKKFPEISFLPVLVQMIF